MRRTRQLTNPPANRLLRSSLFQIFYPVLTPVLYPKYTFTDVGGRWYREHEADAVGLTNGDALVAGKCKFTNAPLDYGALSTLEDHAAEIRWTPDGGGPVEREYALFSRSGFTESVEAVAGERADLRLFGLTDVLDAL